MNRDVMEVELGDMARGVLGIADAIDRKVEELSEYNSQRKEILNMFKDIPSIQQKRDFLEVPDFYFQQSLSNLASALKILGADIAEVDNEYQRKEA